MPGANTVTLVYAIFLSIIFYELVSFYRQNFKELGYKVWKPAAAWNRALIYFCICNFISIATGTFNALITQPIATAEQLMDPVWIMFCVSCFVYVFIAYWILWGKMTITFDRRYYLFSEVLFGVLWGFSMGQVLLSFYHLWSQLALPFWAIYIISYTCMGLWQYFMQDYFWDIYVSPEHDTPRSIMLKTLVSHIPNVALCLLFVVIYENYLIYILTQIFALVAASIFQKFPAPSAQQDFHAPKTKPGLFGLPHGAGYVEENEYYKTIQYDEENGTITDYCTDRGFPLGGLGTGGFNILTDGGFGKFRTNHNWFRFVRSLNFPKGTFFAIRTESENVKTARIMRRNYQGGKEFQNIKNIEHTVFKGRIPQFELSYEDSSLPVDCQLSGFTSIIPHNTKDSSLPVAFFRISVQNNRNQPVDVSLLLSFENILGLGGSGGSHLILLRDGPVAYRRTRGNYQIIDETDKYYGIRLKTKQNYKPNNPRRRTIGEYLICSPKKSNSIKEINFSGCSAWNSKDKSPSIFTEFETKGEISDQDANNGNSGAYCVKFTLEPKSGGYIDFNFIWWTPYYVIEKNQRIRKLIGIHNGKDYGHYYLNHFTEISQLANYSIANRERIYDASTEINRLLEKSTLPAWLQTYTLNSADSMLVNTLLTKNSDYYMIEGCPWDWIFGGLTGTIDQRLASHPYSATFFPELDLNELFTFRDLTENGRVPHGDGHCDVALGTTDVPYGEVIKIVNETDVWTDLPQSFILQLGKTILHTGNMPLLQENWQIMNEMIDYLRRTLVDDIPEGITTYDYAYYKPHFIYSATVQIATLKMMITLGEELQKHLLEGNNYETYEKGTINSHILRKQIDDYSKDLEKCTQSTEKLLWDKRGFFKTCSSKESIFTSGLAGDWIARYAGLGPVIDYKKAKSHNNWQFKALVDSYPYTKKKGLKSRPRVFREADVNGNEIPVVRMRGLIRINYANNPWQSIAYQAIEAVYLGNVEKGLSLIKRIWEKGYFEGYPWNMNNWGFSSHIYMTHPTMWSIFNSISGISINLLSGTMKISPRLSNLLVNDQHLMELPVFFPNVWFWFSFNRKRRSATLTVIKSFKPDFKIKTVVYENENGEPFIIDENINFRLRVNEKIKIKLPEK